MMSFPLGARSLGCILYELVTGSPPFNTTSIVQLVKKITGEAIPWPGEEVLGARCRGFLEGLLQRDPDRRLSWPHLLHHPFVCDRVKLSFDGGESPTGVSAALDGLTVLQL